MVTAAAGPVAVPSVAWSTALGCELEAVWNQLLAGTTGFRRVPDAVRLRNDLAAVVPAASDAETVAERLRRLTVNTIRRALADTPWIADSAEPAVDLVLGTSLGDFLEPATEAENGERRLHDWADDVARQLGCRGRVISLSTACSSSADAILLGAELIRSGASQVCVCGGADVVSSAKRQGHSALGTLSPNVLRPFDERRAGTLLGEGAAFLVLCAADVLPQDESLRGGTAWLRGAGSANDGASMSGPDPAGRGARLAIERSLRDAQLEPRDIGVIQAHGSGTPLNDDTEVAVYNQLFSGDNPPAVFGTKGAFGHSLGATGAIEAIALLLALKHRQVPPTAGLEQPLTAAAPLRLVCERPLAVDARFGLSLTLGFGGFDTSLVLEWREPEAVR